MIRIDHIVGLLLLVGMGVAVIAVIELPAGREFSAEVVDISPTSQELTGRIYAGKRKVRLESISRGRTTIMIHDSYRCATLLLDPQKMTYMKFRYAIDEFHFGGSYSHSRDVPCGSSYKATRVGTEAVNGRMAEKWRYEKTRPSKYTENIPEEDRRQVFVIDPWHIWYDMEHSLMVRYVYYDGDGRELRNVRMEPQPDDLFVVPPCYKKDKSPFAAALGAVAGY